VGDAGVLRQVRLRPAAALVPAPDDLTVFVLSVGDGDSIVVRFPVVGGRRSYGVVDCNDGDKTIELIGALEGPNPVGTPTIRLCVATHPHSDHVGGLPAVLRAFDGKVDEFWDSGFRYTSTTYRSVLEEVERQATVSGMRFLRPTSGFELFHAGVRVTVLSPSIALRNRYDTYGVDVNNASIVLRLTYPVALPSTDYPATTGDAAGQPPPPAPASRTVILGGDAQTDAWGNVLDEFPHFDADSTNWARAIGSRTGAQPLACDLFKVSHHGSKRGVNLELMERLGDRTGADPSRGPRLLVASCATGAGSSYGFPHEVTQDLMREVRDPVAQSGGTHRPDDQLGIHYTSQVLDGVPAGQPAGSIAYVARADGSDDLYRLCEARAAPVDLTRARRAT
jgi:beta-lactamase superfamily II metal-dependent hydrolase